MTARDTLVALLGEAKADEVIEQAARAEYASDRTAGEDFQARVLADALSEATAAYWERRASALEEARRSARAVSAARHAATVREAAANLGD